MPNGEVQWIDEEKNVVHLLKRGREYLAPLQDVNKSARVPGAPVHFDIARRDGVDWAKNVTLRSGTRSNANHRRFGDLTGAREPGAKSQTTASSRLGIDVSTPPLRVGLAFVECITNDWFDDAIALMAANATIHDHENEDHHEEVTGRAHIASFLEAKVPRHADAAAIEILEVDGIVRVVWPEGDSYPDGVSGGGIWSLAIEHGQIVEIWIATAATDPATTSSDYEFVVQGELPNGERIKVEERIDKFLASAHRVPDWLRVKVRVEGDKAHAHSSASATVAVSGKILRAKTTEATAGEAIDVTLRRLQRELDETISKLTDHHKHDRREDKRNG